MSDNEIGAMMKGYRKTYGVTQRVFGDQCGLYGSDISAYECGRREMTPGILERIKEAYPTLGRRIAKAMRQGNGADEVLPGYGMPRPKPEGKTISGNPAGVDDEKERHVSEDGTDLSNLHVTPGKRQIVLAWQEDVDRDILVKACGIICSLVREFEPVPDCIYYAAYDHLIDVISVKEE